MNIDATPLSMQFKKYQRLPFGIIENGKVWKRDKVKGWYSFLEWGDKGSGNGYCERSKFLSHYDFIGCKKIMKKKDMPL